MLTQTTASASRTQRNRSGALRWLAWSLGVLAAIGVLTTASGITHTAADLLCLSLACLFPFVLTDRERHFDTLRFVSAINLLYFGLGGFGILILELYPDVFRPQDLDLLYRKVIGGNDPSAALGRAAWLLIALQASIFAGYVVTKGRLLAGALPNPERFVEQPSQFRSIAASIVVSAIALIVANLLLTFIPADLRYVFSYAGSLFDSLFIFSMVCAWYVSKNASHKRWRVIFFSVLALRAGLGLFTGWKGPVILVIAAMLMCHVMSTRRVPWIVLSACVVFITVFYYPWAVAYRDSRWYGDQNGFFASVSYATERFASADPVARTLRGFQELNARVGGTRIAEFAGVVARMDSTDGYMNGDTIWPFVANLVPRAVWPGKPELSPLMNAIAIQLGKGQPTDTQTSRVLSQFSDLYLNFGLPGMLVGGLLVGLWLRNLNSWLCVGRKVGPASLAVLFLFLNLFVVELPIGQLVELTLRHMFTVLLFGSVLLAVGRRAQRFRPDPGLLARRPRAVASGT